MLTMSLLYALAAVMLTLPPLLTLFASQAGLQPAAAEPARAA
jgi:hypothetical protein